nr:hypothetical protein [Tanacetum cinerariifolium]
MDMLKQRLCQGDRISALPDCVILEILSRLPTTKDAIRTSCLSKRWRPLWTLLPNLIFINDINTPDAESRCYFFSCVDKTITQSSGSHLKLNKFQLHSIYDCQYESQVNKWIRDAINWNVQDLNLSLWDYYFPFAKIVLDELLFNNSILTHLKLACFFVNPTGTLSWKNLKSLYISLTDLNEDLIQNILSGSPLLETFTLDNCYGFKHLDITSKSVKKLVITRDTYFGYGLSILKAPNILSLKIQGSLILWKIALLDLSSLVEAHLDYTDDDDGIDNGEVEEHMLEACIQSLVHVKELKLGLMCSEVLSRLEAKVKVDNGDKGWHETGNIWRIDDNGNLWLIGRHERAYSGGENIYLGNVKLSIVGLTGKNVK